MPLFCLTAFFNTTSNILRTGQTFNLTLPGSCTADYTVDFGDSSPIENVNNPQKIVSHTYTSAGNYAILVQSGNAPAECTNATKSVEVRDPIQNMVSHSSSGPQLAL